MSCIVSFWIKPCVMRSALDCTIPVADGYEGAWKCNCIGIGEAQFLRASVTPSPSNNEQNLKWPIVPCHVSSRNKSDSRFLVLVSFPETDVWFCNRETFSLFFLFCFTCTCVSACWNLKCSFVFFPLMLWPMCHWRKFQKLRQSWRAPS